MADQLVKRETAREQTEENGDPNEETEPVLSMVDVLEEEKQMEEDANAVLGDSDPSTCTYLQGYVPRQAIYACATCINPLEEPAGICLACSLECHEGHELFELYTKRNFRCDCGTSKFAEMRCKLVTEKCPYNEGNKYNQNFVGKYCTCAKPYPDPDDDIEDEMIQCVICEDWYHGRHLETSIPEDYDEMVCLGCMKHNAFLLSYNFIKVPTTVTACDAEDKIVEVEKTEDKETEKNVASVQAETISKDSVTESDKDKRSEACCLTASNTNGDMVKPSSSTAQCKLDLLPMQVSGQHTGSTFWKLGWRTELCKCSNCMKMYESKKVTFLTDESDTIHAYEARGKARQRPSQYDAGLQALSSIGRVQQVEALQGYHEMKTELTDYLKKFAENKEVVKEEDIKQFFSQLSSRKKQKVSHIPHFCK